MSKLTIYQANQLDQADDGWTDDDVDARVIQGTLLKCVDGKWSRAKERLLVPEGTKLLALSTLQSIVRFHKDGKAETIVKRRDQPLPDIDALNAEIPQEEWQTGLDGKPRPPWGPQHVVYLIDPRTAERFTYANGTHGARRAVGDLKDAVKWMRVMRCDNVVPLVELSNAPMPTKFGGKLRPAFKIVDWREFGGRAQSAPAPEPTPPRLDGPAETKYAEAKGRSSALKPIESVTTSEALDDEVPF